MLSVVLCGGSTDLMFDKVVVFNQVMIVSMDHLAGPDLRITMVCCGGHLVEQELIIIKVSKITGLKTLQLALTF